MSRIQTPRFVSDLYRDMRDRRLLIPIAALLVALVAVPVLLSGGDAQPAPPPATPVASDDATQVQAAVLAEQGGIRNYRRRLEALKRKNPFQQKFALPTAASVAVEEGGETAAGTTDTGSAPVLSPEQAASISSPSSSGGAVNSGGGDPAASTDAPATTVDPVKTETRFFTGRADVTVGPLGQAKKVRGVRALDMLPSQDTPVVAFLGLSEDAERAVFVVSGDVVMSDGDGRCAGKGGGACQFIELAPGDQRFLHLADGSAYRLRVLDTDVVRVPDPRK